VLSAALAGCFYADPINQRPSIDIRQTSSELIYRGATVELTAVAEDPDGDHVAFQWRAYACTDAAAGLGAVRVPGGCDGEPFETEANLARMRFVVPSLRFDDGAAPVRAVLVVLEARDELGAVARPVQLLALSIANYAPVLEVQMRSRYGYVVKTPVDIYAKVSDPDDGPDATLPLAWKVFTPMNQPLYSLSEPEEVFDPEATDPPTARQFGSVFTPDGAGEFEVQVTATDPLGVATTKSVIVNVGADRPPCLAQWTPIAAPQASVWPMTDPTLFQISVVQDDLDPYPISGDPVLEPTRFAWSILPPGASARQALGVTSNSVALDPANYQPGDIIELRVEIADRVPRTLQCADTSPTCSVSSDTCIQRLTWRVEVR
jgi:hypothetical protein